MTAGTINQVIGELRRSMERQGATALGDGELLERYVRQRDEAAFEALLHRHGPMILGVCNRILGNEADAQDAFQATFLVLVRKASTIRPREMVSNWLFGVARTTALKARAMIRKRQDKEKHARRSNTSQPAEEVWNRVQSLFDDELSRLPEKLRLPIILREMEGQTIKQAAQNLGWPQGTVAGRLSQARNVLARQLSRHGLSLSASALAVLLSHGIASAKVPASLALSTSKGAACLTLGQAGTGLISPHVAALTDGVLKTLLFAKLVKMTTVIFLVAIIALGGGLFAHAFATGDPPPAEVASGTAAAPQADSTQSEADEKRPPSPLTDPFGDPLPAGAIARLGTLRFRHLHFVSGLAYSPDEKVLASACWDGTVRIWDPVTGKELRSLQSGGEKTPFTHVVFGSNGKTVIALATAGTVHVWNFDTGKEIRQLHDRTTFNLAVAPDGKTIAKGFNGEGGGRTPQISIWDGHAGKMLRSFASSERHVCSLAFSAEGKVLAAGEGISSESYDEPGLRCTLRLWEFATGRLLREFKGHTGSIASVAFSPAERVLASGSHDSNSSLEPRQRATASNH